MEPLKDRLITASIVFIIFFLISLFVMKTGFLQAVAFGALIMVLIEGFHFATGG